MLFVSENYCYMSLLGETSAFAFVRYYKTLIHIFLYQQSYQVRAKLDHKNVIHLLQEIRQHTVTLPAETHLPNEIDKHK